MFRSSTFCAAVCLLLAAGNVFGGGINTKNALVFAADMARNGNWREAKYRWEILARDQPENPKLLNNLAVTCEVLGEVDQAREYYEKAAALSKGDRNIEHNLSRFKHFWDAGGQARSSVPAAAAGGKKKSKGKTLRVGVRLPVAPRLELDGRETLLVTSFLSQETELMNTNRELVRYLRSEFRKASELDVLDVVPPPAIPEQTLEDLLANTEFWRHLGRTYEADLIVSGVIVYDREDASSFQDVDYVSSSTGQKVRTTRFVEQERFQYRLDVFFVDGKTGEILFRDRLQRAVIFQGLQNDPFAAFYELSESISSDVLSVVTHRTRQDTRIVFKK